MSQQNHNLGAFFQKAKSEPAVVSDHEIDRLLDQADKHGRLSDSDVSTTPTESRIHSNTKRRRHIMTSIAAMIAAGIVGASAYIVGTDATPEQPRHNNINAPLAIEAPMPEQMPLTRTPIVGLVSPATVPAAAPEHSHHAALGNQEAPAGKKGDGNDNANDDQSIEEKLSQELQRFVESYWLEKINGYRNRIDRMLPPSTVDELNRLRVRYALLDNSDSPFNFGMASQTSVMGEGHGSFSLGAKFSNGSDSDDTFSWVEETDEESSGKPKELKVKLSMGNSSGESDDAEGKERTVVVSRKVTTNSETDDIDSSIERKEDVDIRVSVVNDQDRSLGDTETKNGKRIMITQNDDQDMMVNIFEDEDVTVDGDENKRVIIRREMTDEGDDGAEMELELDKLDMKPMIGMLRMAIAADESESSRIMVQTWDIAERNRVDLDALKETIFNDLETFNSELRGKITAFVDNHRSEMPEDVAEMLTTKINHASEVLSTDESIGKALAPLYEVIVEPMILLYNGSDINGMISSAIAEPVAGVSLDANTTLKQSYPNPASNEATIEYSLREPSSATALRLFDSKGSEVRSIELGSQGPGTHSATLNVGDLPAGMYLYHLTVDAPAGEQVYSKTLQVAR